MCSTLKSNTHQQVFVILEQWFSIFLMPWIFNTISDESHQEIFSFSFRTVTLPLKDLPNMGSIQPGHQTLTRLLMPCCACRQETIMAVSCESIPTADWDTYSQSLDWDTDHCQRVRERNEGDEGYGNPIGRKTVSTNLDHWELPKTNTPSKEQ